MSDLHERSESEKRLDRARVMLHDTRDLLEDQLIALVTAPDQPERIHLLDRIRETRAALRHAHAEHDRALSQRVTSIVADGMVMFVEVAAAEADLEARFERLLDVMRRLHPDARELNG